MKQEKKQPIKREFVVTVTQVYRVRASSQDDAERDVMRDIENHQAPHSRIRCVSQDIESEEAE